MMFATLVCSSKSGFSLGGIWLVYMHFSFHNSNRTGEKPLLLVISGILFAKPAPRLTRINRGKEGRGGKYIQHQEYRAYRPGDAMVAAFSIAFQPRLMINKAHREIPDSHLK